MKFLLGAVVGVVAAKPILRAVDKYVGKSVSVVLIQKVDDSLYKLRTRTSDYLKDNI